MDHNAHNTFDIPHNDQCLSLDSPTYKRKDSTIFSLLPSIVQSRLPKLASIRKTMCTYSSDFEVQHDGLQRNLLSAECSSEIILRDTQSLSGSTDPGNYLQSGDERRRAENQKYSESDSGIDWKFANQGASTKSLIRRFF